MNGKLDLVNLFPVPGDTTPLGQEGVPRGELADAAQWFVFLAFEAAEPISVFAWRGSFCCWEAAPDGTPVFACGGACGCGGCSTGEMTFTFEGCAFTFGGWSCSCSHVPPDRPGEEDEEEPDPLPGASERFSPRAVIFEDAYEPSDGVKVPRRSTRTTLVCSASGGPNGGTARFEATGDDCVLCVSGPTLPLERRLGPGESFETEVVYEGQKGPGRSFRVKASFTDDSEDAKTTESVARLDVAEIEIMVREYAPANDSPWRHTFGICEEISCNSYPNGIGLRWLADEGALIDSCSYKCPSRAASNPLKAVCGDVEFTPVITVLEPRGIEARNPRCQSYGAKPGRAGWIGLRQEFFATPLDVSFKWLHMEEVPSTVGRRMGYFARPGFDAIGCHSEAMGAGKWLALDRDNRMGECDIARITTELLRVNDAGDLTDDPAFGWEDGWIAWEIPFGWTTNEAIRENPKATPLRVFDPNAGHRIEITSAGLVTVRKFGNCVQRDVGGRMACNGVEWKEEE